MKYILFLFSVLFLLTYCNPNQDESTKKVVKEIEDTINLETQKKTEDTQTDSSYYELMEEIAKTKNLNFKTSKSIQDTLVFTKYGYIQEQIYKDFSVRVIDSSGVLGDVKQYLEIDKQVFDLRQVKVENNEEEYNRYWIGNEAEKFFFASQTYYLFYGSIYMCNGSICGGRYYFLYNKTQKTLNIFSNFRWGGYFGDVNNDHKLDYINTIYQGDWQEPDSVKVFAYTQDLQGSFTPMKAPKGSPYFIEITFEGVIYPSYSKNARIVKKYWID